MVADEVDVTVALQKFELTCVIRRSFVGGNRAERRPRRMVKFGEVQPPRMRRRGCGDEFQRDPLLLFETGILDGHLGDGLDVFRINAKLCTDMNGPDF